MFKKVIAATFISAMGLSMLSGVALAATTHSNTKNTVVANVESIDIDLSKITEDSNTNPLFNPEVKQAIKNNSYTISGLTSLSTSSQIKELLAHNNTPYNHIIMGNAAQVQRFIGLKTNFEYTYFYGSYGQLSFTKANFTKSQFLNAYPEATQYGDTYVYGSMKVAFKTLNTNGTMIVFEGFGLNN